MKRLFALLVAMILVFATISFAMADGIAGVLVSRNASVRATPDVKAKAILTVTNGQMLQLLYQTDGWYYVRVKEAEGYILAEYVLAQPVYLTLSKSTIIYSDPWGSGLANGLTSSSEKVLVKAITGSYLAIQMKGERGTSFIKVSDIKSTDIVEQYGEYGQEPAAYYWGNFYSSKQNIGIVQQQYADFQQSTTKSTKAMVNCTTLKVRAIPLENADEIGYLHYGDLVYLAGEPIYLPEVGDSLQPIWYTLNGNKVVGYVHLRYLVNVY